VIEGAHVSGSKKLRHVNCRAAWLIPFLTVCPQHNIAISTISADYADDRRPDFTRALMENWAEVIDAANNAVAAPSSESDRYFCDRLNGHTVHNGVLDDLPYYAALEICGILGSVELEQPSRGRRHILTAGSRDAVQRGFTLIQRGYPGLGDWLKAIDRRGIRWKNPALGTQLYGPLYRYLNYRKADPEFAPIVEFVRNHAISAQKIGPENDFLGQKGFGRFHSTRSASTRHGIPRETISRKLKVAGLRAETPAVSGVRTLVDAKQMDEFAARLKDSVSKTYVKKRLCVSEQIIDRFRKAGLLTVTKLTSDPNGRNYYSSAQLEALIARLEEHARKSEYSDTMVPFLKCAQLISFDKMIVHALNGDLALGISKESHQPTILSHFLVDIKEIARLAPRTAAPAHHYSSVATISRMAVSPDTVRSLGQLGVLKALQHTEQGAVHTAYSMASVRTFLLHHISFRRLAGSRSRWDATELRVSGVKPAFDFGGVERIYRKSDLGFE
jgi:hypothetical protein